MSNEIWRSVRSISGFERCKNYDVSSLGRIRVFRPNTLERWQGLEPIINGNGYSFVKLYDGKGQYKIVLVHRLILMAFVGPPPTDRHQANHKDGQRLNNAVENLEWVTHSENMRHAMAVGLLQMSWQAETKRKCAKLTAVDVEHIKTVLLGRYTQEKIAALYGVSRSAVSQIACGRIWKDYTTVSKETS